MIELLTGVLFGLAWIRVVSKSWPFLVLSSLLILISLLIVISLIDIRYYRIPNSIILAGCIYSVITGMIFPVTHTFSTFGIYDHDLQIMKPWSYFCFDNYVVHITDSISVKNLLFVGTDCVLGLLLGGGLLLAIAEIGKFLFGSRKIKYNTPVKFTINRHRLSIDDGTIISWKQLFLRKSDELTIMGVADSVHISSHSKNSDHDYSASGNVDSIKINVGHIHISSQKIPLSEIDPFTVKADRWICPQEALGTGDVKLVAMLGLFLGPSAILFIIFISSFTGALFGVMCNICISLTAAEKEQKYSLPYGPFISFAAFVYLFAGYEIFSYIRQFI